MPGIGIGIGINNRRVIGKPAAPTGLSASFTVNTISGDLTWTDNSGGKAQYEIYSSTNSGSYTLLTTTTAGATSYSDTTCKQNASVVYRIRAKKGLFYSDYVTTTVVSTPLCWKINQSTLTTLTIYVLNIAKGKTVTIDWGDSTSNTYSGANTNITKNYSTTGQFNVSMSGDLDSITRFEHKTQPIIYGDISNWLVPTSITALSIINNSFTGKSPNLKVGNAMLGYYTYTNKLSGSNITIFNTAAQNIALGTQLVLFPTSEVDKFFKAAADWYQVNAPTANCTFNLSGENMGIPTGGASNVDIVRLIGYYSAAGFAATVLVRTN